MLDSFMDNYDVYKVEAISDSYLVASGLPDRNDEGHVQEICSMALAIQTQAKQIIRPDQRASIKLKAGIHSGEVT